MIDFTAPSTRRAELLGAGALFLILAAFVVWYMATNEPGMSPTEQPEEVAPSGSIEEHGTYFDIQASYPTSLGVPELSETPAHNRAITRMKTFVEGSVRDFKRQGRFETLTPEDAQIMGFSVTHKESLGITHERSESSATVSFTFSMVLDTLGAHPNLFYRTFLFDKTTGAPLSLSDIFAERSGYLDRLAALAKNSLQESLGDFSDTEYIALGTTPSEESFENFTLSDTHLTLLFPPYQVAPYAAGPQRVAIPLSAISAILKAEYLAY